MGRYSHLTFIIIKKLELHRPDILHPSGIFELIACIMIFVMGITMLKMDRGENSFFLIDPKLTAFFFSQSKVEDQTSKCI